MSCVCDKEEVRRNQSYFRFVNHFSSFFTIDHSGRLRQNWLNTFVIYIRDQLYRWILWSIDHIWSIGSIHRSMGTSSTTHWLAIANSEALFIILWANKISMKKICIRAILRAYSMTYVYLKVTYTQSVEQNVSKCIFLLFNRNQFNLTKNTYKFIGFNHFVAKSYFF